MICFNALGRMGRLGNQMFQYATLAATARRRGYEFCIPPSTAQHPWHEHKLFVAFDLAAPARIGVIEDAPRLEARHFHFDPEIAYACPDGVDLRGFFQTELYFRDQAELIRREFAFKADAARAGRQAIADIGAEVIALHVRRTDYVDKAHLHPPCGLDYYRRALGRLPSGLPVLVFSDDLEWCKAQPLFWAPRFVFSEGSDTVADLCLMTLCRHHIIANSSYSWWGAWLNPSPDKLVIAPERWFGSPGGVEAYDSRDIVPVGWERI